MPACLQELLEEQILATAYTAGAAQGSSAAAATAQFQQCVQQILQQNCIPIGMQCLLATVGGWEEIRRGKNYASLLDWVEDAHFDSGTAGK